MTSAKAAVERKVDQAAAGILLAWATATYGLSPWLYLYAAGGTLLVWLFHTDNLQRLLSGTERKIGTPAPEPPTTRLSRGSLRSHCCLLWTWNGSMANRSRGAWRDIGWSCTTPAEAPGRHTRSRS